MSVTGATPLIEIASVVKQYGGNEPIRIARLAVSARDRLVVSGLGPQAAEMLMLLISGAVLPDEGEIRIDGVSTATIATDQQWLRSLDRFGLVSGRAVLIEQLPTVSNLALPLTLSIDPLSESARMECDRVAQIVALSADRLGAPVSSLTPAERLRLHLGRALIQRPQLLLLEHPTRDLSSDQEREDFGRLLAAASSDRAVGWLAVSDDDVFANATHGTRVGARNGELLPPRRWWRLR
jgi:predicted ABC-type transport system involved in lysophospholipase L1 biosynthesis ATPase subunit